MVLNLFTYHVPGGNPEPLGRSGDPEPLGGPEPLGRPEPLRGSVVPIVNPDLKYIAKTSRLHTTSVFILLATVYNNQGGSMPYVAEKKHK